MLVACRLAGLSALGAHYAGVRARTQFGPTHYTILPVLRPGNHAPLANPKDGVLATATSAAPAPPLAGVRPCSPDVRRPGRGSSGRPRPARLERVLTRNLGPSSIPSLGDGVMLGTAWIDRPVDTQGCAPCFHALLSAAWKRGHAQANDRHSYRVFAMLLRGFARTTRNG
jgi:hypothetical protein